MSKKILLLAIFFTLKFNFAQSDEKFELGKSIFLNVGNCGACHSLKDAGTAASVGPNFNEIKPDIGRVINAVTNGIGVMPAFLGMLSEEEINAVSYYVSESSIN